MIHLGKNAFRANHFKREYQLEMRTIGIGGLVEVQKCAQLIQETTSSDVTHYLWAINVEHITLFHTTRKNNPTSTIEQGSNSLLKRNERSALLLYIQEAWTKKEAVSLQLSMVSAK